MASISGVPYTFTNGTTADGSQVNANFSSLVTSINSGTAALGANTDITTMRGLSGGTASAPAVSFAAALTAGLYYSASTIGLAVGGVGVVSATSTGATITGTLTSTGALSVAGNAVITGNITSATWNGVAVAISYGGTGATTATQARVNLQITSVPTRQTVLSGPLDSSGFPSFLTATYASLVVTTQNINSSFPLVVTSALGYLAVGANDLVGYSSSNLTFPAATANATNYLYVTVNTDGTLTPSISTLAPIYQFGGGRSTTAGQVTFNYGRGEMYGTVGNGSAAVVSSIVCIGYVVAGASTITSTVAFAYQGQYVSPLAAVPTTGSTTQFNHNIGVDPTSINAETYVRFVTAFNGFSAGNVTRFITSYYNGTTLFPMAAEDIFSSTGMYVLTNNYGVISQSTVTNPTNATQVPSGSGTAQIYVVCRRTW